MSHSEDLADINEGADALRAYANTLDSNPQTALPILAVLTLVSIANSLHRIALATEEGVTR